MQTTLLILAYTSSIEALICIYAIVRAYWVIGQLQKLIQKNNLNAYSQLDFHTIVSGHGFWHWDLNYYLKETS